MSRPILYYTTDPLCPWCYAMAPVITRVENEYADRLRVVLLNYGLCAGDRVQPVTPDLLEYVDTIGDQLDAKAGVSVSDDFVARFKTPGFVLDSDPAARAAVAIRRLHPGKELAFIHGVQRAHFERGADPADPETLSETARDLGIAPDQIDRMRTTDEIGKAAAREYAKARKMGLRAAPSALLETSGKRTRITVGYQDYDAVAQRIDAALADSKDAVAAAGDACKDGVCSEK